MAPSLLKSRRRPTAKAPASLRLPQRLPEAARPEHLREANCRMLLRLLRKNNPCSKADLVRSSGLSATTVSVAVAQLTSLGLVEEMGEGESSGGRPPGLLRFNAKHGYVVAADIGGTRLRMMLADLNGNPVAQWATHLGDRQKTPRAIVALMQNGVREMARSAGPIGRMMHVAVGAPGITDVHHGVVAAAPNLQGWTDFPLRALIEREMHVKATVENDVNLAAVGEHAQGVAKDVSDFIFIALGTGVGAGIFIKGSLHHGAEWSAGEIGYLPVVGMSRQTVQLEETGQLERAIGGEGIETAWQKLLRRERRSGNAALAALRASQVFDLAEEGHPLALEIVTNTARILADAIGTIALLFNPQMVVLGGGVGAHRTLGRITEAFLKENQFAQPTLRSSLLGTEAQLFGAVSLALAAAESELLC